MKNPVLFGVVLALVTAGVVAPMPDEAALGVFGIVLGLAVGAYLGASASEPGVGAGVLEAGVGLGFLALAVAGVWLHPLFMAVAWVLHAGWDWLHHARKVPSRIVRWVPPFCAVYDLLVAAYMLWRWG